MSKHRIGSVGEHKVLYRDRNTGIAWIEDGTAGIGLSLHPSIHGSGSIRGMKSLGFWDKADRCVRSHGFIYNIDRFIREDDQAINAILIANCHCGGNHDADGYTEK